MAVKASGTPTQTPAPIVAPPPSPTPVPPIGRSKSGCANPSNYVAAAGEKLPVIIWSHGGGPKADGQLQNNAWGNALAAAGFVVVHMGHAPRTEAQTNALYAEFGLSPAQGQACFGSPLVDRPRDMLAVIRDLGLIEAQLPGLPAPFDLARLALAGHSYGAYTVRTVAGSRVDLCPDAATIAAFPANWPFHSVSFRSALPKAFMALSPQGPGRFGFFVGSWADLDRPDITMSGDGDDTTGGLGGFGNDPEDGEQPADRIFAYTAMPPGNKLLMYIASTEAIHPTFNLGNDDRPEFNDWVRATGIAFMDSYLQARPAAQTWLSTNELGRFTSLARVETR